MREMLTDCWFRRTTEAVTAAGKSEAMSTVRGLRIPSAVNRSWVVRTSSAARILSARPSRTCPAKGRRAAFR